MKYFLAKTEPETYSIDHLEKDKITIWDGVRSPQAIKVIQSMREGDKLLIYHSGTQAALMGLAQIISDSKPDPKIEKSWVVSVEFLKRFSEPITLKEIKGTGLFDDWNLVYQSRLSTMAVPEKFIKWLKEAKKINL